MGFCLGLQYYQIGSEGRQMEKFDCEYVIKQLQILQNVYNTDKDIRFQEFCSILDQFCIVFKALNSFLGIAFSDVKKKVTIIQQNNVTFKGMNGFFAFIKLQIDKNLYKLNGDNNNKLNAAKEYKKYSSTSRNLLRMMWLLTFIRVTFEGIRNHKTSMSDILCKAYDSAFGEKHSWIIRNGAKLAIKTSNNRKELIDIFMGYKCQEDIFQKCNERFLEKLIPIHQILWNFYKENNLTNLQ